MISKHQEDVKPPRACELCHNKRAVWYCASDDAFLCHVCDESVHSANQVVTKHERVSLRTNEISKPVWHSGFRRKPRTRRVRFEEKPQVQKIDDEIRRRRRRRRRREDTRVPEIGGEGMFFIPETNDEDDDDNDGDNLTSLVPEFQGFAEMEFFLTNHDGTEVEDFYYNEEASPEQSPMSSKKGCDNAIGISAKKEEEHGDYESNVKQRNMLLRLNYENVIAAWDKQESPREAKSEFNSTSNFQLVPPVGVEEEKRVWSSRSEREARVWRYRDKRKNRLFEKKIRYEVRKVNADKRPRMKGRFVRTSLATES